MSRTTIARYVNPWKFRREEQERRLSALRQRDGDECRRCRRPLRFDLPAGHDLGVRIEQIASAATDAPDSLANFCLTHGRCNAKEGHDTAEVRERVRLKTEAALFEKSRSRRRA